MRRYFLRALTAQLRHGRSLFLLSTLGVALGVASVLCIQILNANSLAAFSGSLQAVSGDADLSVVGCFPTFDERIYPRVLGTPGVESAWPLWRGPVVLAGRPQFHLEVIGADVFAPIRYPLSTESKAPTEAVAWLVGALAHPGWVAVTPELAEEFGWAEGDTFRVVSGSRSALLTLGARVDFRRVAPLADPRMMIMDLAQAQSLLGERGRIHQIDLRVAPGTPPAEVADRLSARLGATVRVVTPEQREQQAATLLAAFRLNLTALSLISLFVGLFLVYTTTQASLQRRRREFGLLRTLGATRRQVLGLILGEVLLLGLAGTALGIPIGYWAARENIGVVSSTLTNLYLLNAISALTVPRWIFLLAAAIGLGGALAGAVLPALDISRRDTRALLVPFTLHERIRLLSGRLAGLGGAILFGTAGWFWVAGRSTRAGGFLLGAALLVGLSLMTPLWVQLTCGRLRPRRFDLIFSWKGLSARLHTSSFAVAALGAAVSMLFGVTLLIQGFRRTVDTWIGASVRADVYVSSESWARGRAGATISDSLRAALAATPGVRGTDVLRQFLVPGPGRQITLNGVNASNEVGEGRFLLLRGDPAAARRRMEEGAAMISEPLSAKTGLGLGDSLELGTPLGPVRLPICGVYYDYSTEGGSAAIDLGWMTRWFGAGEIHTMALYLEPGRKAETTVDELRERYAGRPLLFRSNRRVRDEVMAIFDQTFAVTRILQAMSLLIAVAGIALTLLVQARERVAELALYRALGAGRRQIFGTFLGEGIGIGSLGLLLGAAGGCGLAMILIFFINRAWFGWTIRMDWPWPVLIRQSATILATAVLAAVYPALRASRVPASELAREG